MGQAFYSPISINSGQVAATQTDFPVLVSQTDNRFKTISNGGHVANSSGFDIRPYSDSALTTAMSYELERYNSATGELVMWVKVPSLTTGASTPIYLGYGDTSLTTDGSSGSNTFVLTQGFLGVYHLKDGTTLSVASSTGSNNGTNHSATATAGKIDGGANFVSASTQYIDVGNGINPTGISLIAWVKATSFPNAYNTVICRSTTGSNAFFRVKSNGKLQAGCVASVQLSYDGTGSNTLSTATWYHIALTYNSTNGLKVYVNASSDNTVAANGTLNTTTASTYIAHDPSNAGVLWNGDIDEVWIMNQEVPSTNITTAYNNQSAPGTFETLGTEVQFAGNQSFFLLFP